MPSGLPKDDDLRALVDSAFGNVLMNHGFKEVNSEYSEESFGNATLEFYSKDLNIRFDRDRGQVTVDVSGPRGLWVSLQIVKDLLTNSEPTLNPQDLKALGQFSDEHYNEVVSVLTDEKRSEFQKRIEKYLLIRGQKMFGDLLPADYFNDINNP